MAGSGPKPVDVAVFYRHPARTGGTSIPAAFDRVCETLADGRGFRLHKTILRHPSRGLLPRLRAAWQARREARRINHISGDVHFIALALPAGNTVLTIHDLDFLHRSRGLRRWILKKFWLDLPVARCRVVTTVSDATRQDLLHFLPRAREKTRVIHGLISANFRPSPLPPLRDPPVVLHVGSKPNKNLRRHIEALRGIRCELHVIGRLRQAERDRLRRYGIDYVERSGIDEAAMQRAYEQCDLLLYASTREGFGMPIVEAQTVGRPVITSMRSSMPEIAGDGAHFVDPFDVESIHAGLLKVLSDNDYRTRLVERGYANCRRFSAADIAEQWREVYREILRPMERSTHRPQDDPK